MPQKSFLISIFLTTIFFIVFGALAKALARSVGAINKKNIYILIFISILNSIILFSTTYLSEDPFILFWVYCFVFLMFGIVNILVMHEKFLVGPGEKKYAVMLGEVFFSFSVMLFVCVISSLLQFYLKDKQFLFYPVLISGVAFIIPLFFYYTFEAGRGIPATDFHVWEYPVNKRIDPPDESVNENMFVIGFDIPKRAFEKKTAFRAKAPENIVLGDLFYHFINEYNDEKSGTPIEYLNANKEPIMWWFRLKRKWYQFNKVLDPSQRIRDNFIQENSVIVCEQLMQKPEKLK